MSQLQDVLLVLVLFYVSVIATMLDFPAPFTSKNKILGMILSYNYDHIDPLLLVYNEYLSMCEGGWNPSIVLYSTALWSEKMRRFIRYKMFCYRTNATIPISYSLHNKTVGTALASFHRKAVADQLYNFDVFIYQEDDMLYKHHHLVAYLHETKKLYDLMPDSALRDYTIGYQRYRRLLRGGDIHHAGWSEQDMYEQELLEEEPSFSCICLYDRPYLAVDGNKHQAVWSFTRDQILILQNKCSFLNQSSASREYMSSFSLFDHKGGLCRLRKLLPAEGLTTFAIHHYYQGRHPHWTPVFSVDESLRLANRKQGGEVPACWQEISHLNGLDQDVNKTT